MNKEFEITSYRDKMQQKKQESLRELAMKLSKKVQEEENTIKKMLESLEFEKPFKSEIQEKNGKFDITHNPNILRQNSNILRQDSKSNIHFDKSSQKQAPTREEFFNLVKPWSQN